MEPGMLERILFPLLLAAVLVKGSTRAEHSLQMDKALFTVHNQLLTGIRVSYVSDHCYKCLYQPMVTIKKGPSNASVVISTHFPLALTVETDSGNATLCRWRQTYGEAGHYSLWVQQSNLTSQSCSLIVDKNPVNSYLPLLVGAALLLLLALAAISWPYLCEWYHALKCINCSCCKRSKFSMDSDGAIKSEDEADHIKPKSSRLKSLDTFRGHVPQINRCTVASVIFRQNLKKNVKAQ